MANDAAPPLAREYEAPSGTAGIAGEHEPRPLALLSLCGLALGMGVFTGYGAVFFRALIGFVHNLMFLGKVSFAYDASVFTPASPWGAFVILVPVIGSLGVTFIVNTFAPEAKGHGVPEVMDAIYYSRGLIRPVVAAAKSVASALAIGSGAAVGREGPIIQIGSALGSTLGQFVAMPSAQRITLVAAGAGAGIAATFNTPIGGVLFATELMMPEVSVNTFLPVAVATGSATFIGRLFFGSQPAFAVPQLAVLPDQMTSALILLLYAGLGAITGVAAATFVKALHWAEDIFDRIPVSYFRHAFGMLLVGVLIYVLLVTTGHYFVEGVGYSTIQAALDGRVAGAPFFLLLFACKLFATTVSLGSGSSGGIFSPSLFMGATLGAALAGVVGAALPGLPISPAAFAMVGMGAMVGGGTGAAMTAVTMIFEMTRDYDIVLPMILAVALSLGVRRVLSRENIYTMKLVRRGHAVPQGLHANLFLVRSARDVMLRDFAVLDETTTFAEFLGMSGHLGGLRHVVTTRGNRITGVLRVNLDLRRAIGAASQDVTLGALPHRRFTVVRESAAVFDVIARMRRKTVGTALVIPGAGYPDADRILGIITKEQIADSVAGSISLYRG